MIGFRLPRGGVAPSQDHRRPPESGLGLDPRGLHQHPLVTGLDPQGVKEPSPSVINNRRQALTRVWRELGHESDRPTRAEAEEMVQQTDRCVTALTRLYPTEASFRSMSCAFAQMVRAMGLEQLAATYRESAAGTSHRAASRK